MSRLLTNNTGQLEQARSTMDGLPGSTLLLDVLWRRRWTMIVVLSLCILGGTIYIALATRIYSASATVVIDQNAPRPFSEKQTYSAESEAFVQTQAETMRSTPVLARAMNEFRDHPLATFAPVKTDVISWLRKGNGFSVDVPRKSSTIVVSMESPFADEATVIVRAVIDAFVAENAEQQRTVGGEMVKALIAEKDELLKSRQARMQEMLRYRREAKTISLKEDSTNPAHQRLTGLYESLGAAEVAAIDLRAQLRSLQAVLKSPELTSAYVASLQSKGRDSGDREYDELRTQLIQQTTSLSMYQVMLRAEHPRMQAIEETIRSLKVRLAEKERGLAEAQLVSLSAQSAAADEKEQQLRKSLDLQQAGLLNLAPAATEYAKLQADVDRIQKKLELLETRIAEVDVNSVKGPPLTVRVLQPARALPKPVKPAKPLVAGVSLLMGLLLGMGAACLREWRDARLRSPEEIPSLLGVPVIAMVPQMNPRLSPATRGQILRLDANSPVAEAYRSAHTSLRLGPAGDARTILVASPMENDGKTTCASNLAIAYAQAGERTLLIDCDLRQPVQHLIMETDGRVGLTSVLAGEVMLRDAVCPTRVPGLFVLACGPLPASPAEVLSSKRFAALMTALSETFERIVIDSPPLIRFTDARILAAAADVTVLVLRMNKSIRPMGALALAGLAQVGANVVGAVANDVPGPARLRAYSQTWQYATRSDRLLLSHRSNPSGGEASEQSAPASARTFEVKEPQWAESGGGKNGHELPRGAE